jgi:hypothetical protein
LVLVWVSAAKLAPGHGGDGDEDQERNPYRTQGQKSAQIEGTADQDAQHHGPSGGLDGDRHEPGDAGGRAFVSIGRPLVERDGCDFEQKASEGGDESYDRDGLVVAIDHALEKHPMNDCEICAAG